MTPVTLTDDDRLERRRRGGGGGGVSAETAKWVIGMTLAALVSYFSTTYGLQARIDILEARVKASESNIAAVQTLTAQVAELNQRLAVLTAIVERIEQSQTPAGRASRYSRMFDK